MARCKACGAELPDEARFCPSCGAEQSPPAGAEERKLATVLFADLVGSTAQAHGEDPERVRARLDRFYAAMTEEIERTGGVVEKFAGDAVMAAFGAPSALEDHAERALHAALAMQRRLAELFGGELRLRIGVNTGDLVVGQAREASSFVTGDAVNAGARLEQAAEAGEVLAGERTVAAARGAFEFGEARIVGAKGMPDGVLGRPVVRALTLARPRGVAGFRSVFVGRESELELLRATFRRAAAQGEPHLVTVVGEPGVGKTRLVRELWQVLASQEPAPIARTGRCLAYGDGITYWPLGDVLREHFGILEGDPPDVVMQRLEGREILGLALGLDVGRGLHPLDARERLHEATVAFVEELAGDRPVVVLVEDIHWAEDDLLDLLERVARDARGSVLVLATARPELLDRRATWGAGRRNTTMIWLEPLAADAAGRLLRELVGVELPAGLRELLVERAEGNPFFVEELVGALVDAGVLVRREGAWAVRALPEGFSVPDSVRAVLAARMDGLPPTEKAALQAASVVGRQFWPGAVRHLLDGADADFDVLEERDFVRRHGASSLAGEREYSMKHALTRDVAYAGIPKARRGRLHAALAEWLETLEGAQDEHASLLAYHYSQAVRPEDADLVWADDASEHARLRARAVHWLRRAGELASGRYEMDEAVELLTRAAELADDAHEKALIWIDLGRAHAHRYDGEAMRAAILRSLDGPLGDEERASAYAMLAFQSSIRSAMWAVRLEREQIEDWAHEALRLAPEGSEPRARALLALADVAPEDVSDEAVERAAAAVEALGNLELRSYAFAARCQAAFEQRRFDEAATWSERRLELMADIDDPDHLCEGYEAGVPVAAVVCHFGDAERLADLHWQSARRLSAHHRVHAVSLPLELADLRGDWGTIVSETDRVVDAVSRNLATPCVRNPRDLLLCAVAQLVSRDEDRAAELEREARKIAGRGYETYLSGPHLRLALERGDLRTIEAMLELAVERSYVWGAGVHATRLDALLALRRRKAVESEVGTLGRPGLATEPFALRALGGVRGDDDLIERAQERFRELGLEWHAAQTERLLAGLR